MNAGQPAAATAPTGSGSRISSTHHVISVKSAPPPAAGRPAPAACNRKDNNKQLTTSPEGEKYGFGAKFKECSKQYFDMSASYPNSVSMENQKFIDSLSSKLMATTDDPKAGLNAEIQSGVFNLKKTNGIVNDKSAPRF